MMWVIVVLIPTGLSIAAVGTVLLLCSITIVRFRRRHGITQPVMWWGDPAWPSSLSPQIGYLVGSGGMDYMVAEYLRVRATNQRPVLLRAMQSMIGQELRAAFELPKAMPRELVVLLAQMNKR